MKKEMMERVNRLAMEIIEAGDNANTSNLWTDLYFEVEPTIKALVNRFSVKYTNYNVDKSDLETAVNMALMKAVDNYKVDNSTQCPFYHYFVNIANVECRGVLRQAKAQSRKVMAEYINFSATVSTSKDGNDVCLGDAIPDSFNLENEAIFNAIGMKQIRQAIKSLSDKDSDIIKICITYSDNASRTSALRNHFKDVKDATLRKNKQRALEKFAKALIKEGYYM